MLVEAGKVSEFEDRKGKAVTKGGLTAGVFKFKDKFYAVNNVCPHMQCPLSDGMVDDRYGGHYIVCACHGWEFNVKDGSGAPGHSDKVESYPTVVKDDIVYVDLPISHDNDVVKSELEEYLDPYKRSKDKHDPKFSAIQQRAITGEPVGVSPMSTKIAVPKFESILFRGAQLATFPLLEEEEVNMKTVIGKKAKVPLELEIPFFVSHMSFGALSIEAKTALAKGASATGTAIGSGEGGLLPEERQAAEKYIYEWTPASFTQKLENVKDVDAIELKFGQGTKPGMGGHLTQEKITEKIMKVRGIPNTEDFIAPSRFENIKSAKDIKALVDELRKESKGKPIGIKFAAGHVEKDLAVALKAEPDFITIDGRGGGTGASSKIIKDNYTVPAVIALAIAGKYLKKKKSKVDLVITGGLRDSMDVAKSLAMGVTACALATASLMGIGCQQYRTCHTGNCPVGITTHREDLRERFDVEKSSKRLTNFFNATRAELKLICQTNGKNDVHKLEWSDIFTTDYSMHKMTGIDLP